MIDFTAHKKRLLASGYKLENGWAMEMEDNFGSNGDFVSNYNDEIVDILADEMFSRTIDLDEPVITAVYKTSDDAEFTYRPDALAHQRELDGEVESQRESVESFLEAVNMDGDDITFNESKDIQTMLFRTQNEKGNFMVYDIDELFGSSKVVRLGIVEPGCWFIKGTGFIRVTS